MRKRGKVSRLDVKIGIRLTSEDLEKLERLRQEMGWSKSELTRWAVREMIKKAFGFEESVSLPIPKDAKFLRIYSLAKDRKIVIEFV